MLLDLHAQVLYQRAECFACCFKTREGASLGHQAGGSAFVAFCVRQDEWHKPASPTLLCYCVRQGKIKSLEQIYLFSLPVKEYQIVEAFLGSALKDEVMKIMPVQKQTRAGQRTRFKARHTALVML